MTETRAMTYEMLDAAERAASEAQLRAWAEVPSAADVVAAILALTGEDEVFLTAESLPFSPIRLFWRIAENDAGDVGLLVRAVRLSEADAAVGKPS